MSRVYLDHFYVSSRVADINAAIAALPMIADGRREHAVAMAQPMLGCPWLGEPAVDLAPSSNGLARLPAWFDWEMGRYAAALLRKRDPAFASGDLSHLRTRFEPPATMLFVTDVRCRRSRRHPGGGMKTIAVAEVLLPDHALGRGPTTLPAAAGAMLRPLPREVPRLGAPSRHHKETSPMLTTDNRSSRGQSGAARAAGDRT